jgi:hypothetical protein
VVPFVAFELTNNQSFLHYLWTYCQLTENLRIETSTGATKIAEIVTAPAFALMAPQSGPATYDVSGELADLDLVVNAVHRRNKGNGHESNDDTHEDDDGGFK